MKILQERISMILLKSISVRLKLLNKFYLAKLEKNIARAT